MNKLNCRQIITTLGCYLAGTCAIAQEASTSLQSTVSGNQEQPRVMYIVPWQRPEAAQFDYTLENRIAEELFSGIDRDEFLRGLNYRDQLHAQSLAEDTQEK